MPQSMRTSRPKAFEITLSMLERKPFEAMARSRASAHRQVQRAQIILRSAAGESNTAIAAAMGVSAPLVSLWRARFWAKVLAGLYGVPRVG